jgi:hypothetical protein
MKIKEEEGMEDFYRLFKDVYKKKSTNRKLFGEKLRVYVNGLNMMTRILMGLKKI